MGFEALKIPMGDTKLRLTQAQKVESEKKVQTQAKDLINKQRVESTCWFCVLSHGQTWKLAFFHVIGNSPQGRITENIYP